MKNFTLLCKECDCYYDVAAVEAADLAGRVCDRCAEMIAANACQECERGCSYPLREDLAGYKLCEECYDESMLAARKGPHSSDCPVWVSEPCACSAGKLYRGVAA